MVLYNAKRFVVRNEHSIQKVMVLAHILFYAIANNNYSI